MEGTLKSDVYQNRSDARRFLVYRDDVTGKAGQWTLVKQVGFHTVPGLDISDIVLDSEDSLYVLQRSWNSETGNKVALSYVSGLNGAPDVSGVANLNDPKNASEFVKSRQIGELDKLPDLGASAKPGAHQANPLMDNYEGLVITNLDQLATPDASWYRGDGEYKAAISIISDDNYSATQTTRILDVEAEPFRKTAAGFDDSASGRLSQYVTALGRNDRLDYWSANGFSDGTGTSEPIAFGGLSSTAYNRKLGQYVSAMDNHGTDVARLWLLGNDLDKAAPTGSIVLTDENGTPYNGETTDDEGLGVLPNGDFLLTSEGHPNAAEGEHEQPKIRIFGIDGRQKDELPVPELFDINCRGQAVHNKSLEALTVSPSGHQIVVGNEYALKNDSPSGKDIATTARRALVYRDDVKGAKGQWKLVKQVAFKAADVNMGITEFAAIGEDGFLVLERSWDQTHGYGIKLAYAHGIAAAPDVSDAEVPGRTEGNEASRQKGEAEPAPPRHGEPCGDAARSPSEEDEGPDKRGEPENIEQKPAEVRAEEPGVIFDDCRVAHGMVDAGVVLIKGHQAQEHQQSPENKKKPKQFPGDLASVRNGNLLRRSPFCLHDRDIRR